MTLAEIIQKQGEAVKAMRDLNDKVSAEKRNFAADEKAQWDRVNADYDRLKGDRERLERLEKVEKEQGAGRGDREVGREDTEGKDAKKGRRAEATQEQRSLAFRAWARSGRDRDLSREERAACKALGVNPRKREIVVGRLPDTRMREAKRKLAAVHESRRGDVREAELRAALSAFVGTSGAYLVSPGSLAASFEMNQLAYGGVRNVADEMTTESGEPFLWPTVDDTGNQGEQLGESASVGAGVNPVGQSSAAGFTTNRWDAWKFSSKPVLIPSELLDDDQYDLEGQLGEMLGTRLGRITATKYATGSGAGTPEGIVTGATLGVTAGSATAFKPDDLRKLQHSVDPAWRSMPGVGYLMHDSIVQDTRLLKDGEGRYLWQPGLDSGAPDRIDGYPVGVCQEMASSVATTNKVMLFGLLSRYKIRKVKGMRLFRLTERYRDTDQDAFIAFIREDGRLLKTGTPAVKYLQMA